MKISVVTPSYNSGSSIERAIQSVLEQNYPDFEHIIVDGGSTDQTLELLKRYKHLTVISERDNGQADAMNKGLALATGDIIGFLNADDFYSHNAFSEVAAAFDDTTDMVIGNVLVKSTRLNFEFLNCPRITIEGMIRHWEPNAFPYNPVGYFCTLEFQRRIPYNVNNYESMDLEFLLEAASQGNIKKIDFTLGCFDDTHGTKTDRTQLMPHYWRASTFPYIERYLDRLDPKAKRTYEADRREGYSEQQAQSNLRAKKRALAYTKYNPEVPVTVIIPTHNDLHFLRYSIDSVLQQTHKNIEIVVVDDAGSQSAEAFLKEAYVGERRIKQHRHGKNKMLGGARNTGIELASGDYLFFLDADDELVEDAIQNLVSIALETRADVVQGGSLRLGTDGATTPYHSADFTSDGGIDALWHFSTHRYASVAWNKLYAASFLKDNNSLRFTEGFAHEDVVFALRSAYFSSLVVSVSTPVIRYRVNPVSITRRPPTKFNIESYITVYQEMASSLEAFDLPDAERRELTERIIRAHLTLDYGSKLIDCKKRMGATDFSEAMRDAGAGRLGALGLALADLILLLMEDRKPPREKYTPSIVREPISRRKKIVREFKRIGRQIKGVISGR